ncbi:MAG: O-methyltransferase [Phycisphaerales bacterium]|nr:O-methyltransferase [Phycisphaerales bacterium]MCI0674459.1 O-methyltransferase [Phycisphaerales bacterium]
MTDMTPQRWQFTNNYSRDVFGRQDPHLANLMNDGVAKGLPDIAVSADVGRLLYILTSTTRAKLAIEVGTLGGYSGIWIARALSPQGKLITIEPEKLHADFALIQFQKAGVADRVDLRRAPGLQVLPQLARELPPKSVDVIFLDAIKTEYPAYWKIVRPLIAVGGLIIADNVYGSGDWWIDDLDNPSRQAADQFNRLVANDADFEAVAVPLREGVLIGRRMR